MPDLKKKKRERSSFSNPEKTLIVQGRKTEKKKLRLAGQAPSIGLKLMTDGQKITRD